MSYFQPDAWRRQANDVEKTLRLRVWTDYSKISSKC